MIYVENCNTIFYTNGLEKLTLKKICLDLPGVERLAVEIQADYKFSKKKYYERVLAINWNEEFLFFKNGKKRIEIYCRLDQATTKLFTIIEDVKGKRLVDFLVYGDSIKSLQNHSFGSKENQNILENGLFDSSIGFKTFILLCISSDGFICPYQVRHSKQSSSGFSGEDSRPNIPKEKEICSNFVKRLNSPKIQLFEEEELTTASICPREMFVVIASGNRDLKNPNSGLKISRMFLFRISDKTSGLKFYSYVDLIKESYSLYENSFFTKMSLDFNQGTKQPFIIAFTHGGDHSMAIFRVNSAKDSSMSQDGSNYFSMQGDNSVVVQEDGVIEKIGVVKNYHSRSVLSMWRCDDNLWTLDSLGLLNRLNSNFL